MPDPAAPVATRDVVELACAGGCGLLYSDPGWVDVCIPVSTWAKIAPQPDGGGVLCLTCMTRRLKAAGIHDVPLLVCDPHTYRHGPYDERDAEIARCRSAARLIADEFVKALDFIGADPECGVDTGKIERLVKWAQDGQPIPIAGGVHIPTPTPDPRDARIAVLEAALREVRGAWNWADAYRIADRALGITYGPMESALGDDHG